MVESTLPVVKVTVTEPGTHTFTYEVTANGLPVEKTIEVVIKPEPVTVSSVVNQPFGYALEGGVTGGSGDVYEVDTYDKLKTHMTSDSSRIIVQTKPIKGKTPTDQGYYCKGNKTLVAMPGATLNFGFWWYGTTGRDNVILRNLDFDGMPVNGTTLKDYITFKEGPQKIWYDRIKVRQTKGVDGLIDIGDDVEYYTGSHILAIGAPRAMSLGTANDTGTLAFVLFEDCTERQPAVSQGKAHLHNLMHVSIKSNAPSGYGVSVRDGAEVRVTNGVVRNFIGHPYRVQKDYIPGTTTLKPLGKIGGISTSLITNSGTNQLFSQPESTWEPVYDYEDFTLSTAELPAYLAANCGQTMTAAEVTAYIASL